METECQGLQLLTLRQEANAKASGCKEKERAHQVRPLQGKFGEKAPREAARDMVRVAGAPTQRSFGQRHLNTR